MPKDRLIADRDHRLGYAFRVVADAGPETSAEQDRFHVTAFFICRAEPGQRQSGVAATGLPPLRRYLATHTLPPARCALRRHTSPCAAFRVSFPVSTPPVILTQCRARIMAQMDLPNTPIGLPNGAEKNAWSCRARRQ